MTGLEVITMGRVSADIYPEQTGTGLEDVTSFRKFLGGTATNVAVAAARYGHRCAVITRVGADPFGRYVRKALTAYGVSDMYVSEVPGIPTPVTFCEIFRPITFRSTSTASPPRRICRSAPTSSTSTRSATRRSSGSRSPDSARSPAAAPPWPRWRPAEHEVQRKLGEAGGD